MNKVENKIALITGGLGGIGLAIAKEFLENGLKGVAIVDIDTTKTDGVIRELTSKYGTKKVKFVQADVTNETDVENAFTTCVDFFGALDIVINGAGIIEESKWEQIIDLNLKGAYRVLKMAMESYLPKHKSGEEGLIVNISSVAGLSPIPWLPVYSATKSGLVSLAKSLLLSGSYDKYKVKCLTICPGATKTVLYDKALEGSEEMKKYVDTIPIQTAEQLAKMLITVIAKGENGSIWVCDGGVTPYIHEENNQSP